MNITFTGIDERTDLARLKRLLRPDVEIGILVTTTPEGRHRYPRLEWITEVVKDVLPGRCALHFCGKDTRLKLLDGTLFGTWFCYPWCPPRVQINGVVSLAALTATCDLLPRCEVITQHTPLNAGLANKPVGAHSIVIDGSGGRGVTPTEWAQPRTFKRVGFAGGLGAETIPTELPKILRVIRDHLPPPRCITNVMDRKPPWIDMENRLRDPDDWFDIGRMEAALAAFDLARHHWDLSL